MTDNLIGLRDRAILLLGFSGAFRRLELVALNPEDTLETADGLVVTLRRGKTDQEAEGRKVATPRGRDAGTYPVRALSAWAAAAIAGKSERAIMNQTGHRSSTTVRRYIRDANLFLENAADGLGL